MEKMKKKLLKKNILKRRHLRKHSSSSVRLQLCLIILLVVVFLGTLGYKFGEGWNWLDSLYMTIITVSTVGYGEVFPLSEWGRGFTIVLIVFGTGSVVYGITGVIEYIVQRQVQIFTSRLYINKMVKKMKDHIIICGYGRMGHSLAKELMVDNTPNIVVIENNPEQVELAESDGFLVIDGDATEEEVLEEAGLSRATSLVATLSSDADNLFLVVTARQMSSDVDIIVRLEDDGNARKFLNAGANRVVSPYTTGAKHIYTLLRMPGVTELNELISKEGDISFELSQLEIDKESKFVGKLLADSGIREEYGGMVIAVRHCNGKISFNPAGDCQLNVGDHLYMAVFTKR
jgi:voltage-gated potassium channel